MCHGQAKTICTIFDLWSKIGCGSEKKTKTSCFVLLFAHLALSLHETIYPMRKLFLTIFVCLAALSARAQSKETFSNPPAEMCSHVILGWDGEISAQVMERDLDAIQKAGFRNVIIEPGYRMGTPYLSEQWFQNVRMMADAVARRGMKMWIIDEGKYPSGGQILAAASRPVYAGLGGSG